MAAGGREMVEGARATLSRCGAMPGLAPSASARAPKVVLALAGLRPGDGLEKARGWGEPSPPAALRPRMVIAALNTDWGERISPGSYDDMRRRILAPLARLGAVLKNADDPARGVNCPATSYSISAGLAAALRAWGQPEWELACSLALEAGLARAAELEADRKAASIPLAIGGKSVELSPGAHNDLQARLVSRILPAFAPGGVLVYLGDAADKRLHVDEALVSRLGIFDLRHAELPDILWWVEAEATLWVVEAVVSGGQVSAPRLAALEAKLSGCAARVRYASAFPDSKTFRRFSDRIAWGTEAWIAGAPGGRIVYAAGAARADESRRTGSTR